MSFGSRFAFWWASGGQTSAAAPVRQLLLSDFDASGLEFDFLALLEAEGSLDLFQAPAVPVDGDIEVGSIPDGSGANLTRIRWVSSLGRMVLQEADTPAAVDIGAWLTTGGGANLSIYVQTDPGGTRAVDTITARHLDSNAERIRLQGFSSDFAAVMDGISAGDRFILGLGRVAALTDQLRWGSDAVRWGSDAVRWAAA